MYVAEGFMRQRVFLFITFTIIFAASSFSYAADLSFGGGIALSRTKSGGYGEFGATIYKNNSFEMRNYLSIDGYGNISTDYNIGYLGFTEKITFGMSSSQLDKNIFVLPYGFVAGNFSLVGAEGTTLGEDPFYYEVYAGLGADIYSGKNMSIFVEAGGGYESFTSRLPGYDVLGAGFARINVGIRGFVRK